MEHDVKISSIGEYFKKQNAFEYANSSKDIVENVQQGHHTASVIVRW